MQKILTRIVISAACLLCALFLVAVLVNLTAGAQAKQAHYIEEAYVDSAILVEAFVVEAKLSALYDSWLGPLGEKRDSVTVEKIQQCLQNEENARITAGAKLLVKQTRQGKVTVTQTTHIKQPRPGSSDAPTLFQTYQIARHFTADAYLSSDYIGVKFDFSEETLGSTPLATDVPPDVINRQWAGTVHLAPGKPCIVGATQDDQKAVFLIISADFATKQD